MNKISFTPSQLLTKKEVETLEASVNPPMTVATLEPDASLLMENNLMATTTYSAGPGSKTNINLTVTQGDQRLINTTLFLQPSDKFDSVQIQSLDANHDGKTDYLFSFICDGQIKSSSWLLLQSAQTLNTKDEN